MSQPAAKVDPLARQRASARRTALRMGMLALAIYVAFLLRGVLGA